MDDRYGSDVLAAGWRDRGTIKSADVHAELDLVVEVASDGFCGAVTGVEAGMVELEDWKGRRRRFPLGGGFLVEGRPVRLGPPKPKEQGPRRTASGSFAVADQRARIALPSRILVEGKHDAELVEKVWGADLRVEGVVVEFLQGVDLLDELLAEEPPSATRRYGVLVDHLVPGSKESRIADAVARGPHGRHVRIVGHPFVDVWEGVRPKVIGLDSWPRVPMGQPWKEGICAALGADPLTFWPRLRNRVRSFADLRPELVGAVEQLIDFVAPGDG